MNANELQRQRGSVLLLVLVSILIMVLLGVSYLAIARIDRRAHSGLQDENIGTVISAIVAQIRKTLTDDIVSYDGTTRRFYGLTAKHNNAETGFDEPFDFPWTGTATWEVEPV